MPIDPKKFEKRLEEVEKSTGQILVIVTELKLGVCGSSKIGVEGIIHKVKRHEEYIEKDKKDKYRFAGAVAALTFIITLAISLVAIFCETGGS